MSDDEIEYDEKEEDYYEEEETKIENNDYEESIILIYILGEDGISKYIY